MGHVDRQRRRRATVFAIAYVFIAAQWGSSTGGFATLDAVSMALTFMFGPAGWLLYYGVRSTLARTSAIVAA